MKTLLNKINDEILPLSTIKAEFIETEKISFVLNKDHLCFCTCKQFNSIEEIELMLSMHNVDRLFYVFDLKKRHICGKPATFLLRFTVVAK